MVGGSSVGIGVAVAGAMVGSSVAVAGASVGKGVSVISCGRSVARPPQVMGAGDERLGSFYTGEITANFQGSSSC
jgi:hypothetical protein